MREAFESWLKTRPQNVQDFATKYQLAPGDKIDGLFFLGYGEYEDGSIGLLVTPINPALDYEGSIAARLHICPNHFERNEHAAT